MSSGERRRAGTAGTPQLTIDETRVSFQGPRGGRSLASTRWDADARYRGDQRPACLRPRRGPDARDLRPGSLVLRPGPRVHRRGARGSGHGGSDRPPPPPRPRLPARARCHPPKRWTGSASRPPAAGPRTGCPRPPSSSRSERSRTTHDPGCGRPSAGDATTVPATRSGTSRFKQYLSLLPVTALRRVVRRGNCGPAMR